MKLILDVYGTAEHLAEQCKKGEGRCPVGLTTAVDCPFGDKLCDEITPEDWAKLEVKDDE